MDTRTVWLLTITLAWLGIYLLVGFAGARFATVTTFEQYLVGERREKLWVMVAILMAGQFSGWMFIGVPALSYQTGIATYASILFYGVLAALATTAVWLPASIFGRKYGYVSCADLFADRYESKWLGLIWGVIWLVFSVPYMVGQIMSAGALLEGFTQGYLSYALGVLIIAAVVVLYVVFGGMRSFAWVTVVQCILLLVMLFAMQIYMANVTPGGLSGAISFALEKKPAVLTPPGPAGYWTPLMLLSWGLFVGFGTATFAHLYPRMYAIRDARTLVNMLVVYFICLMFIFAHWGTTGPMGNVLLPNLKKIDNFIPAFLGQFTPPWFGALVAAGALAAILSTVAAILLSMAGIATKEIYQTWIKPTATQKELLNVSRLAIAIWGGLSVLLAIIRPGIIAFIVAMSMGGTLMLFVPMFAAFWWKRANKYGAIVAPLLGEALLAYQYLTGKANVSWGHAHPSLWAFLLCLVTFVATCYLTPPSSREIQDRFHGYLKTFVLKKAS